MNRHRYYGYIDTKLNSLSYRISRRSSVNLLDLNIHAEYFFADLLNYLNDWELENANYKSPNTKAIDLIDSTNKIIVQVSATNKKQKIADSLNKIDGQTYDGYHYIFLALAGDSSNLRKQEYSYPTSLKFDPADDIIDMKSLLNQIRNSPINIQKQIYAFCRDELSEDIDPVRIMSNLAAIVNILSKEDLSIALENPETNAFRIEDKIKFNQLERVRYVIDDYKIYQYKLDAIYSEFDSQGANKSYSVLQSIRSQYHKLNNNDDSADVFYQIIQAVIDYITGSSNYEILAQEELEICVKILVVDAFIRCKIFENPEGYDHAIT